MSTTNMIADTFNCPKILIQCQTSDSTHVLIQRLGRTNPRGDVFCFSFGFRLDNGAFNPKHSDMITTEDEPAIEKLYDGCGWNLEELTVWLNRLGEDDLSVLAETREMEVVK